MLRGVERIPQTRVEVREGKERPERESPKVCLGLCAFRCQRRNADRDETGEASDIYKLVKMIMLKNLNPVIVFAFSKRECESLAMQMSKINMNKEEESLSVENIFNNALGGLNDEDKQLPQIGHILPLLRRGIGVHHGGLLPLLKEVIEILFQEGLIKVLFATETFSIGLNMPAKTVVFTSVQKFDGKEFRHLSGGVRRRER